MTRIDFYILNDNTAQQRNVTACRLAEKAYSKGLHVYLHAASHGHVKELDKLLWSFKSCSFIPHALCDEQADDDSPSDQPCDSPVWIGCNNKEPALADPTVLINLATEVPEFFSRFERVLEIINADDTIRRQGRERFRFYRDRGYMLDTHEL